MTTNSTETATSATGKTEPQKPSAQPAPPVQPAPQVQAKAPEVKKQVNPFEGDARYEQYKVVNLRLLKEGTIQYDPNNPELVLTTFAAEGQPMPLTPFFSSRINQTLELVI